MNYRVAIWPFTKYLIIRIVTRGTIQHSDWLLKAMAESHKVDRKRYCHRQLVRSIPRLSTNSWVKSMLWNILLYKISVISIMVGHFDHKHRCLIEKNVPITLILPSRWRYGAESLGIEHQLFMSQRKTQYLFGVRKSIKHFKLSERIQVRLSDKVANLINTPLLLQSCTD